MNKYETSLSFLDILQVAFIVLKLCHVIDWPWWVVLLPIITVLVIVVILLIVLSR